MEDLKDFIGTKVTYDEFGGTYLWGVDKDGGNQMIGEVRGYGAIQNLFKNKKGEVDFDKANDFQDRLGKFIAEAITEKLNS